MIFWLLFEPKFQAFYKIMDEKHSFQHTVVWGFVRKSTFGTPNVDILYKIGFSYLASLQKMYL
jgi:hypothetical protein